MLGEFLSANVAMPFLLFMVEGELRLHLAMFDVLICSTGFGVFTDEADVGFWTGILGA